MLNLLSLYALKRLKNVLNSENGLLSGLISLFHEQFL